jgi:glucokinase
MILAGDIGGTKCRLALYEPGGFSAAAAGGAARARPRAVADLRFAVKDWRSLEDVITDFLRAAGGPRLTAAGIGVAGPVMDYRVKATNISWVVDGATLDRLLQLPRVTLLNDLECIGHGVGWLEASDLFALNEGRPQPAANQAVIAAGTGLGEAMILRRGARPVVIATEGGHTDFAPRNEEEVGLWRFLRARQEQVSWEMVLSGKAFRAIHEYLAPGVQHAGFDGPPDEAAPEIGEQARAKSCAACVRTHQLWAALYGAEAGNLAMRALALGGVYVGGGIAVKLLEALRDGRFLEAFCHKSKFRHMLEHIPVYVVMNEETPLLGAAAVAQEEA